MLRSSFAGASKLACLALVVIGSAACAEGLGNALLQDNGAGGGCDSGSHGATTTSTGAGGLGGAGSTSSTSGTGGVAEGTGGSISSSTGGGTCDSSGDCQTCGDCAVAGVCAPEMNACNVDQDCVALVDCLSTCQDQTCADACATQYPDGMSDYTAVITRVLCQACTASCPGECMP
jgi:hypothetical protein